MLDLSLVRGSTYTHRAATGQPHSIAFGKSTSQRICLKQGTPEWLILQALNSSAVLTGGPP